MSGLHVVAMPKWGLSMEEGQVVAWHRQAGDIVAAGDDLIDVETSKITNTIEAPADGVLLRTLANAGEVASCGMPLAVIGAAGAPDAEIDAFVAEQGARAVASAADHGAPPEPSVRVVTVGGVTTRLRYLDTGAGDDTILLIHGFGGDLDNWMFNQPALAAAHRVIAVDLPGHGGSGKDVGDGSAQALAAAVAALLEEVAPGLVHLVAHSFGAVVARHLARLRPDGVGTVVAIAPADLGSVNRAYIDGFIAARRRSDLAAALALLFADPALVSRDMAEALLRYKRLDGVEPALRAIDRANFASAGPDPAAASFWIGLGPRGRQIWGAEDAVVSLASASSAAGGGRIVIDRVGHMPHLEKPDRVNAVITGLIAQWYSGEGGR